MARRRYKNYKSRNSRNRRYGRGGKKTNLRWIIFLLILITVGVVVTKKFGKSQDGRVDQEDPSVTISRLLDNKGSDVGGDQVDHDDALEIVIDQKDSGDNFDVLPPDDGGITSDEANALVTAAGKDIESGKLIATRNKLNKALHEMSLSNKDRDMIKDWLTKLSDEWLFSESDFKEDTLTGTYEVVSGDVFESIGKKYKVPYGILMQINGIKAANKLNLGNIKVINGPFHAKIQLSKFNMDLYLQDQYVKSYKIGIGKPGEETPTGKWRLKRGGKLDTGPSWLNKETGKLIVASDPEYPLGARWIPIECFEGDGVGETGIALHGTKDPQSIGTRCSLGCIRLHDNDVIEVYKMLYSGISTVEIVK